MHIDSLLKQALESGNLDGVYTQVEKARLKPVYVNDPDYDTSGYMELVLADPETDKTVKARLIPRRPAYRAAAEAVDRSVIHDFENVKQLEQYARDSYPVGVAYTVYESEPNEWTKWGDIHVSQITIDADLRGLGIASHLRKMLTRYADKKGYIISGTPTNRGDGTSVEEQDADHKARALKHRERLVASYYRSGYVDNPCWHASGYNGDWLTGEFQVHDPLTQDDFTPEGVKFLSEQGQYVRFPNGKVPKGMLRRGRSFDATGYRAPAPAPTKAEASERYAEISKRLTQRYRLEQEERIKKLKARQTVSA
jgi:GNAT superfamily N-acetyltransferase